MFLSPKNEPPEEIQELINSTSSPSCASPAAAPSDMESGRNGSGSASSSRMSTSDPLVGAQMEKPGHGTGGFWARYISLQFLLLLGVTASLLILPLVLPPLPPPPSMLMLVPVAMLLVLLALAFMPSSSAGHNGTPPTYM